MTDNLCTALRCVACSLLAGAYAARWIFSLRVAR